MAWLRSDRLFDPIRERVRQRREAERNLPILKDIALDDFESWKAKLKGDGKAGRLVQPAGTARPSQARSCPSIAN